MPVVMIAMLQASRNHARSVSTGGILSCHSFHFTAGTFVPAWHGMQAMPFARASSAMARLSRVSMGGVDCGNELVDDFMRLPEPLRLPPEAPVVGQVAKHAVRHLARFQE